MSETVSESPNDRPYARLIWPEAVSIASLVLNVVVVAILIVAFVGRHHGGFKGQENEGFQHGGPGFGGPGHFEGGMGGPGRFGGGEEHGGFGHAWGDGKFEGHEGGFGHDGGPGHEGGTIDPQEMANHHLDRLSEQYALTDAQKNQIRPILVQAATDGQKSMEDEQKARTAAREAIRAKIRAVLTPDQQKQFDQESQEREHPAAS